MVLERLEKMSKEINLEDYKRAYKQIGLDEGKKGFLIHLTVYIVVNTVLVMVNFMYSPNDLWFYHLLLWWGIGLVMHLIFGVLWINLELDEREAKAEYRARRGDK